MNIFVLDRDPIVAARQHCDRHICKMILEYGQMLSTAHRLLDGKLTIAEDKEQRRKPKKFWLFPRETLQLSADIDKDGNQVYKWIVPNAIMYQVAHAQHPCSVWTRASSDNYMWLFNLFYECLQEYTRRYARRHSAEKLIEQLRSPPTKIPQGALTPFAQAMPDEYKHENVVEAYHRFYMGDKARFARWTNTQVPDWFVNRLEGQDVSIFSRTR